MAWPESGHVNVNSIQGKFGHLREDVLVCINVYLFKGVYSKLHDNINAHLWENTMTLTRECD